MDHQQQNESTLTTNIQTNNENNNTKNEQVFPKQIDFIIQINN